MCEMQIGDVETHLRRVRAISELEQKYWDGSGGAETVMKRDEELTTVGSLHKWECGKGSEIPKIPKATV